MTGNDVKCMDSLKRFIEMYSVANGDCHEWVGPRSLKGYGQTQISFVREQGLPREVHRLVMTFQVAAAIERPVCAFPILRLSRSANDSECFTGNLKLPLAKFEVPAHTMAHDETRAFRAH